MNINILKTVLVEQYESFTHKNLGIEREELETIKKYIKLPHAVVISGLRRAGKSTLMAQIAHKHYKDGYYFVNFDNENFLDFSAADFNMLYETLLELFGPKKVFFLDEVQNIEKWETFVRRLIDDGFKIYISGSNASLLSRELGTRLTGRYIPVNLFPFSFKEYLTFFKIAFSPKKVLTTAEKGSLKKNLNEYIQYGGIPDALKYKELNIIDSLYQDILYRDIASRYGIKEIKALQELSHYLISNTANLFSINKLKEQLKLGSINTVKNFMEYLERSWLLFIINQYSPSIKKQQIAPKKVYVIDTGLINTVGFKFSKDMGRMLENIIFLDLKRKYKDIYYYKTASNLEIDFWIKDEKQLIQVCTDLSNPDTREREIKAISEALKELKAETITIITHDTEDQIKIGNKKVRIIPAYKYLTLS